MSVKSVGLLAKIGNSCIFLTISGNLNIIIFSQPLFVSITLRHLYNVIHYMISGIHPYYSNSLLFLVCVLGGNRHWRAGNLCIVIIIGN